MHNRVQDNELFELASTLLTASAGLNKFLTKSGHHHPSFSKPAPSIELTSANAPYFDARSTIIEAAEQIIRLVRGPRDTLYKFASHIPLEGTTTYAAISESVGQPGVTPALVERIIQHTASFGLFDARPDLEAWMYLSATIAYPAGASVPKAIEQYGYSMESDEAAYGVSLGRKVSQFQ
ncbi:hypothetical protein AC579_8461 [Pseudocercospora musae]|uniref:Uncharacterized protein n=1 Tax=Pseudocercospora musae TaxID=113226 RepID=A0A139I2H4_9PEZI|nr:hypothetical protein AC579_8461 [Pseudocercospora musae]